MGHQRRVNGPNDGRRIGPDEDVPNAVGVVGNEVGAPRREGHVAGIVGDRDLADAAEAGTPSDECGAVVDQVTNVQATVGREVGIEPRITRITAEGNEASVVGDVRRRPRLEPPARRPGRR